MTQCTHNISLGRRCHKAAVVKFRRVSPNLKSPWRRVCQTCMELISIRNGERDKIVVKPISTEAA